MKITVCLLLCVLLILIGCTSAPAHVSQCKDYQGVPKSMCVSKVIAANYDLVDIPIEIYKEYIVTQLEIEKYFNSRSNLDEMISEIEDSNNPIIFRKDLLHYLGVDVRIIGDFYGDDLSRYTPRLLDILNDDSQSSEMKDAVVELFKQNPDAFNIDLDEVSPREIEDISTTSDVEKNLLSLSDTLEFTIDTFGKIVYIGDRFEKHAITVVSSVDVNMPPTYSLDSIQFNFNGEQVSVTGESEFQVGDITFTSEEQFISDQQGVETAILKINDIDLYISKETVFSSEDFDGEIESVVLEKGLYLKDVRKPCVALTVNSTFFGERGIPWYKPGKCALKGLSGIIDGIEIEIIDIFFAAYPLKRAAAIISANDEMYYVLEKSTFEVDSVDISIGNIYHTGSAYVDEFFYNIILDDTILFVQDGDIIDIGYISYKFSVDSRDPENLVLRFTQKESPNNLIS
jgi:hypothetical protein